MRRAADELGVDFDEHLQRVIDAMEARKEELGLEPREEAA
jgi:predicted hydrolase (HD superfamily)